MMLKLLSVPVQAGGESSILEMFSHRSCNEGFSETKEVINVGAEIKPVQPS